MPEYRPAAEKFLTLLDVVCGDTFVQRMNYRPSSLNFEQLEFAINDLGPDMAIGAMMAAGGYTFRKTMNWRSVTFMFSKTGQTWGRRFAFNVSLKDPAPEAFVIGVLASANKCLENTYAWSQFVKGKGSHPVDD